MTTPSAVERLKRRADFVALSRARNSSGQPGLVLQAARRREAGPQGAAVRVGFTASKKVGNAVRRNRAKRRLREVVRLVLEPNCRTGHDFVLIARAATPDRPFDALCKDLRKAMKRLNVWSPGSAPGMVPPASATPSS